MKCKKYGWALAGTVLLVLTLNLPAFAVPIVTSTVTDLGGGLYQYSYDLANPAGSAENLYDFGLFFTGDPSNVVSPSGWDAIFGSGFVDWFSTDIPYDLVAGSNLGDFSFESALGPTQISYSVVGYDALSGFDPDLLTTFSGTTVGPGVTSVPEPGTLMLLLAGGLGIVGLGMIRRRFEIPDPNRGVASVPLRE